MISSENFDHSTESGIGIIAGINGGVAAVYVSQPLDTIKVKMQAFPSIYNNAWKCFRETWVKDGLTRGLYAGTVPALAASVAENAIIFCALPSCQLIVARASGMQNISKLTDLELAYSGFLVGFLSSVVLCPAELIKCRLQSVREMTHLDDFKSKHYQSSYRATKSIVKAEGLRGLYRGFSPTLFRETIGFFFFFGAYEKMRSLLTPCNKTKDDLGPIATAFAGGMGGLALWISIFPFDVVKSRVQVGNASMNNEGKSMNMFRSLFRIFASEGISALYRGLAPTILRTIPATGILFVAVEWTKKLGRHYCY